MKPERELYFGWQTAMFAAGLSYLIEFLHKAILQQYTDFSLSLSLFLNILNTMISVTFLTVSNCHQ